MITEVSAHNAAELAWFKSSYSSNEGGECMEVACSLGAVHVRDSKDTEYAPLAFSRKAWSAFISYAISRPVA
ncbi:MAG: hypothetical protein JWO98_4708 [Frankiales bacterium]|nr:hypothetical protein [Frankiales bacterium]